MKKLLSLKTLLICISFTVFLLLVKDNMNVVWSAIGWITGIITPFAIGFLFAYILNYPYKFFYSKVFGRMGRKRKFLTNFRKPLALIITYAIVVAIFVVIISIVVPQIAASLFSLINSLPQYAGVLSDMTKTVVHWINHTFSMEIDASEVINNFFKYITNFISAGNITSFLGNSTNAVFSAIMSTCNGVYNFLLGIVISVYFLAAKETLCRQIKKLAVAFIPIKYLPKIYEIVDITDTKCGRFVVGDMIDADKELKLVGKANNGEDAYEMIRQKQPDVVLLDLILPKMDGLSVMDQVNNDQELRKHPDFIVITAIGQERITEDAFKKGASYYILKPFHNDTVIKRIKNAGENMTKNIKPVAKEGGVLPA